MENKVLRVGIVGCGEIAQVAHLPILLELPNYKLTALCDLSQKVLDYLGEMYCIENLYTNYEDLVASDEVDIVLVTNHDHAPISLAAMNAGKHVFCEKPMCFNLEEANALITAEKNNNVKFMVGLMKRYDPAFEYALPIIKEMNDVVLVRVHDFAGDYTINSEIYDQIKNDDLPESLKKQLTESDKRKMLAGIGEENNKFLEAYSTLLYLITHDAILLQETFGQPSKIVYADVYARGNILAVLELGENLRCLIEGGLLISRREWDEKFEVFSDNERLSIDFPFPYIKNAQTLVSINKQDSNDPKANVDIDVHVSYDEAFKREWRHFYDCIINNKLPWTNSEKCRNDIELMINIIKTAGKRGR